MENPMSTSETNHDKARPRQDTKIVRQIAFASGLFQGDITIRTILESLAEGVVVIDESGTILLVNSATEKMFNYQREELIGEPHATLIPERFREVHEKHEAGYFSRPLIRPMGLLLDLAGRRRDGKEFPVEISLGFIETINGVLVLALISDVTLRKQLETRLRDNEELFRIQVESVKDFAIFTLDPAGNVFNWNTGAERLKGYRAEEIIGKHFSVFYSEEDRNAGKPGVMLEKAVAAGQHEEEGWRIRKDGSRFWAEIIITALYDGNGNLRGFSKITRDVSERKNTENIVRFSEARYRALFRENPSIILTLDTELRVLSVNPLGASQLGYVTGELEDQPFVNLIHEADRAAVAEQLRECLIHPNQVHRSQFRKIRKDGGTLWVEEIAQAVYDLHGMLNILLVCQDVSDRKLAEEEIGRLNIDLQARAAELESANRELESFNHTVAHDLRQPLSLLNTYCQTITMVCGDQLQGECAGYVKEAYEVTLRMNSLIHALLNFSRMGHVEPLREMVNISSLVHEIATVLKQINPDRHADFRISEGIGAYADANLLRVVLDNLLGNAWKYTEMRENAVIEFGMLDIDGLPAYYIRDNGSGFDKSDADKIFLPFQRLPRTEKYIGFGIGLATVERIIRRHGGKVWAEGEQDKGATFYFTLTAG
jgi:PAS domain S-box-containing protein